MIRSINTANKNMNILQIRLENTNASIANVNTPGYKFQDLVQSTKESQEMFNFTGGFKGNSRVDLGSFVYSNQIDEVRVNFEEGTLSQTYKETDYAIIGNGFFTIRLDDGRLAYTRNGSFRFDSENQLTTMEGYLVLGDEDLLITDFANYEDLISIGETLYISDVEGFTRTDVQLKQGFLEESNVKILDEMIKLMQISREFQLNQKVVHASDETLSKAVNEIGKV